MQESGDWAVVFAAESIKEDAILLLELLDKGFDAGQVHHGILGIDAVETDWKFESIPGVSESSLGHVHFADIFDFRESARAIQECSGEGGRGKDCFGPGADHDEVGGKAAGDGNAVFHGAFANTELDEHEHYGDDDSGGGDHQFDSLVSELGPCDEKTGGWQGA